MTKIVSLPQWCAAALAACLLAVAVAVLQGGPGTASAASSPSVSSTASGGWKRYVAEDFTSPAGDLCRFRLSSTVLFDAEYVRTTASFRNGSPRRQEYVGPLVVRVTNQRTDAHIQRDLSGRAVVVYRKNGGYDFRIQGPAAVGFCPGDSLSRGFYVLRGFHMVRFAADGTRRITVDRGTEHNLCVPLSSSTQ